MEERNENLTFGKWLKHNVITILLVVGVILGFVVAVICILYSDEKYKSRITMVVGFPGELILNALQCMALPLSVAGLILGVTSMKTENYISIIIHIVIFTGLAEVESVVLGVLFGCWIVSHDAEIDVDIHEYQLDEIVNTTNADNYLDVLRSLFPSNVISMTMMHYKTKLISDNETDEMYDWEVSKYGTMIGGVNVFGLIFYSIFFAAAMSTLLEKAGMLRRIFETLYDMSLMITGWLLYIIPLLGIFVVAADTMEAKFTHYWVPGIERLIIAIVCAHVVQCLVVYPLIYFSLVWENPYKPFKNYLNSIITAFITTETWASFPIALLNIEKKEKIPTKLVKFAVPIAQAFNKCGCAIYYTSAIVFIYRTNKSDINIIELIKMCVLGGITSFTGSGIPYKNISCIWMITKALRLSPKHVPLMLGVEWIAGRTANVVNLVGDLYLVELLAVYNKKELSE